jgi:hypothetical protein
MNCPQTCRFQRHLCVTFEEAYYEALVYDLCIFELSEVQIYLNDHFLVHNPVDDHGLRLIISDKDCAGNFTMLVT